MAELKVVPRAAESLHPLSEPAAIAASPSGSSFTTYCAGEVLHLLVGQIGVSCKCHVSHISGFSFSSFATSSL